MEPFSLKTVSYPYLLVGFDGGGAGLGGGGGVLPGAGGLFVLPGPDGLPGCVLGFPGLFAIKKILETQIYIFTAFLRAVHTALL